MIRSVDECLRRLDTDFIDLFWVHAWDGTVPIDEILRGLYTGRIIGYWVQAGAVVLGGSWVEVSCLRVGATWLGQAGISE